MPEDAAAVFRQRHLPEMRAGDIGNAVMERDPLVDERVVRGHQIEQAAVLAHEALEEQFRFAAERVARRSSYCGYWR